MAPLCATVVLGFVDSSFWVVVASALRKTMRTAVREQPARQAMSGIHSARFVAESAARRNPTGRVGGRRGVPTPRTASSMTMRSPAASYPERRIRSPSCPVSRRTQQHGRTQHRVPRRIDLRRRVVGKTGLRRCQRRIVCRWVSGSMTNRRGRGAARWLDARRRRRARGKPIGVRLYRICADAPRDAAIPEALARLWCRRCSRGPAPRGDRSGQRKSRPKLVSAFGQQLFEPNETAIGIAQVDPGQVAPRRSAA